MKLIKNPALLAGLIIIMTFMTALCPEHSPGAEEIKARKASLIDAEGSLKLKRSISDKWVTALPGITLEPGDQLKTGQDSFCILMLHDTSTVRLSENTHLELQDMQETDSASISRMKLYAGKLWNQINKSAGKKTDFQVEAPHTLAAVRGTVFEMVAEETDTEILVFDGAVDCKDGENNQLLKADTTCRFGKAGVIGKAVKLRRERLDNWQKWNLTVDREMRMVLKSKNIRSGNLTLMQRIAIAKRLRKLPPPIRRKIQRDIRNRQLQRKTK